MVGSEMLQIFSSATEQVGPINDDRTNIGSDKNKMVRLTGTLHDKLNKQTSQKIMVLIVHAIIESLSTSLLT